MTMAQSLGVCLDRLGQLLGMLDQIKGVRKPLDCTSQAAATGAANLLFCNIVCQARQFQDERLDSSLSTVSRPRAQASPANCTAKVLKASTE